MAEWLERWICKREVQSSNLTMEEPLESYNQAQRATTTILNTVSHPAEHINFFTARPPTSSMNSRVYSTSNMTPTNMTLMPKTATVLSPPLLHESEKLVKMKNRKMKKQARKDVKNVKQVIVTEGVTDEYNIDNILEELGESESNKKSANKNSSSKTKAERKRSGKLSSSIGKKDKCPGDKLEHSAADDTTGDGEEDDEELVEKIQSGVNNSQEHISSKNRTISPELATQAAMLNRQTSRSTEDMFTPVIKKHSKWKNKKAGISNLSKDDSAHTCSSSSSASSTTSSTVAPSSGQSNASYQAASNSHSSILSAKPAKYNLRRKSALRPSQSFDTMKSASSSVASEDLEASGNGNPASKTKSNRDHLDLATDFPPLSASEASETAKSDQFVPKWVTKTSAGNSAVPPFPVHAAANATIEKSRETETNTNENNDFTEKNNSDQQNNPNSTSSSMSFSPSAVIDASDVKSCKKPPPGGHHQGAWQANDSSHAHHHTQMLPPAPPPDVTVVPLQNQNNVVASHQQQCTANAVMLPDIAAQAPNVMNTTNSSSGVSSNAGDLTPPQTTMMSEPPSFYQFSENEISNNSSNKPGENKTRNHGNQFYPETEMLVYPEITGNDDGESELACNTIEFGFEVNVLDLISKKNQQHLASEDEAIVSFGNTIVLTENNLIPEVGNFVVSGNGNQNNLGEKNLTSLATHHQIHHQQENNCNNNNNNNNNNLCQINQSSTTTDQQKNRQILEERACFDHEIEEEENHQSQIIETGNNSCQFPSETEVPSAVKNIIPNYAQIVQYVAKSWSTVEQELENGLAQQY